MNTSEVQETAWVDFSEFTHNLKSKLKLDLFIPLDINFNITKKRRISMTIDALLLPQTNNFILYGITYSRVAELVLSIDQR